MRWDLSACRTATVPVGPGPQGVAFDGTNIWVGNFGSNNVSKIVPF
jgi:DNA-binding beta-propeller fold protein YncE